jgi:hypothetical protein
MRIINETIWVAVNREGHISATWYKGCVQPYAKWRKAVMGMGYTPIRCTVKSHRGK